jgi:WS/DGAT/MGAT family acyltransferase
MSRLTPLDLAFLAIEDQQMPLHMAACLVFEPPARQKSSFVPKLIEAFRATEPGIPFNRKLKWLEGGVARWESIQPDMHYHVRHMALPPPGSMEQLDDLLAILNAPLLDRAFPLWQCFVIEGLENRRFALFFKLHHALIDGMGALKTLRNSMADTPGDKEIRPIWHPTSHTPRRKSTGVSQTQLQNFTERFNSLRSGGLGLASGLMNLGAQMVGQKPRSISLPFRAPRTPFNVSIA